MPKLTNRAKFNCMYFSAAIIEDLMEYATIKGVDIGHLSSEFGDLQKQKYIGYEETIKTLNFIGRQLNDEYLGLHVGEQISLRVTAAVDSIMRESSTLEESLSNAVQYCRLISDALECSVLENEDRYSVIYEENPNWHVQQNYAKRQILDLALLCNVKSVAAYAGYHHYPITVLLTYEKPKSLFEYYRLFNCRLQFNQPRTEIVFDKHIIDRHAKKAPSGLLENLKEKVAVEIANLPGEYGLIHQVKKCILNHKPGRIPVEEAAKALNMSKRSLQRNLRDMQTTFKKIESALQLKLAKTYLEENRKSLDEISYLLGFSECSAFIRFFRSVAGQTPTEYKKAYLYPAAAAI